MSLRAYLSKRDFDVTTEPKGKKAPVGTTRFVVQKHDATRLHYDLRLEMDGVLKSWAVPKGLPFDKGEKHLAVQVEDHPLEYANFEGTIPKGQYGGGTVMVWDSGTYGYIGDDWRKDLATGKFRFQLEGTKLRGEWTLVRMKRGKGDEWLVIKSGEDLKPVSRKKENESSLSGRTMSEIAGGKEGRDKALRAKPKVATPKKSQRLTFVEPMKATLVSEPPRSGEWDYELKFDGFRALALKNGAVVRLLSRNEKDFGQRFPAIVEAVSALPARELILDGEITALDSKGRSSFQLLQGSERRVQRPSLVYYLFDILREDGEDLTQKPLHERRERLAGAIKKAKDPIRFSSTLTGSPNRLLEQVRQHGLEGLIGKRHDSIYEVGRRSPSWIKLKCLQEQEFVIGGFTSPEGTRSSFGALLVGVFDRGELFFSGKVGTGFTTTTLQSLHRRMNALRDDNCPFSDISQKSNRAGIRGLTARDLKQCHWVKPELVCQVRFTEWTDDGKLRHPAYLGLREDKASTDVGREKAVTSV